MILFALYFLSFVVYRSHFPSIFARCRRYPRYLEDRIKESEEACKKLKEKISLV